MSERNKPPLVPRNWKLTRELEKSRAKPDLVFKRSGGRKDIPSFNGSGDRRDRKNPNQITLPKTPWDENK
jgi:hypothetical protein